MQLELSERAVAEIRDRATASGVDVKDYVDDLLFGDASHSGKKRPYTAKELRDILQKGGGSLGRNGKPWREFIHEGHKY